MNQIGARDKADVMHALRQHTRLSLHGVSLNLTLVVPLGDIALRLDLTRKY
jgi:hypothetical protein